MAAEKSDFGEFCYLNSSCIRKGIILMFLSSSSIYGFLAKLSDRNLFWIPVAMLVSIWMGTSMASPNKSL